MRTVQTSEITKNIREMCIEANHFLSDDMKKVFNESVEKEGRITSWKTDVKSA